MKVLVISDVYFPRVNGVSTSIRTFNSELIRLGEEVELIAPEYPQPFEEDIPVRRVASRYIPVDPEDRMMKYSVIKQLLATLRQKKFDLVHIQTPFVAHYAGIYLAKALKLPVVASYHTYFEEYLFHYVKGLPKPIVRNAVRRFSRHQCHQLDALIVPSTAMLVKLREYGVSTPISVVPTGIRRRDFDYGSKHRFCERFGVSPTRPLLLFVGRVAHEKNIDFLLRTLVLIVERIPNVLLVIAGEGPAESHLKRLADTLCVDENVSFIGYLDRRNHLPDCYAAADLFVFSSRTETQGLVLLESLASGTPIVSTAAMGTVQILDNNPAARVVPEEEAAFAREVVACLNNPIEIRRMESAIDAVLGRWDERRFVLKTREIYHSLTSPPVTIMLVTETFSPEINGVAMTLGRISKALVDSGYAVHVVCPKRHERDVLQFDERVTVTEVKGLPIPHYPELRFGLPARGALRRLCDKYTPDAIYVATEGLLGRSALAVAKRFGIPIVSGFHTNFHIYSQHYGLGWLKPLVLAYLRRFHQRTRLTLVPTEKARKQLADLGINNGHVLGRGVDTTLFHPERRSASLRSQWGVISDKCPVMLYVGRVAVEKNISLLIEAYTEIRRISTIARLVIVGDGPLREALEKKHPDLLFAGVKTGIDLAEYYASADLFLFPSTTETYGNVVAEAMASGLATVAFDDAAAAMHITGKDTGVTVPVGENTPFIRAALELYQDRTRRQGYGCRAAQYVQAFDWPRIAQQFADVLLNEMTDPYVEPACRLDEQAQTENQ